MNNLKHFRETKFKKMTRKEFAALLGISQSYLSELENNTYDPGLKLAMEICGKIKVPLNKLVYDKENPVKADFISEINQRVLSKQGV